MTEEEITIKLNEIQNYININNPISFKKIGLLYLIHFWLNNFIINNDDKESVRLIKLDLCFNNYDSLLVYLKIILNTSYKINLREENDLIYQYIKDNI